VEVDPKDVADLEITVVSAEVAPPETEDGFPEWSNFTLLTKITEGRIGGC
jgi:hypothetical protein